MINECWLEIIREFIYLRIFIFQFLCISMFAQLWHSLGVRWSTAFSLPPPLDSHLFWWGSKNQKKVFLYNYSDLQLKLKQIEILFNMTFFNNLITFKILQKVTYQKIFLKNSFIFLRKHVVSKSEIEDALLDYSVINDIEQAINNYYWFVYHRHYFWLVFSSIRNPCFIYT